MNEIKKQIWYSQGVGFLWVKSLSSPADMCVCVAHFITEFCQGRGGGNTAPADSHIRSMADLGPRGHPMQSGERESPPSNP